MSYPVYTRSSALFTASIPLDLGDIDIFGSAAKIWTTVDNLAVETLQSPPSSRPVAPSLLAKGENACNNNDLQEIALLIEELLKDEFSAESNYAELSLEEDEGGNVTSITVERSGSLPLINWTKSIKSLENYLKRKSHATLQILTGHTDKVSIKFNRTSKNFTPKELRELAELTLVQINCYFDKQFMPIFYVSTDSNSIVIGNNFYNSFDEACAQFAEHALEDADTFVLPTERLHERVDIEDASDTGKRHILSVINKFLKKRRISSFIACNSNGIYIRLQRPTAVSSIGIKTTIGFNPK